jgi:hypothetical protein
MMRHASTHTTRRMAGGGRWLLGVGLLFVVACKDEEPCDTGQESIGTGCFDKAVGGGAGRDAMPAAGETGEAGAGQIEPPGNPDAMFGDTCASNADCGGPAPVCATDPLFYCSQIDCDAGEANEGACPEGWRCFKYLDNPSACVNF